MDSKILNAIIIIIAISAGLIASFIINPFMAWAAVVGMLLFMPLVARPGAVLFFGCCLMSVQLLLSSISGLFDIFDEILILLCLAGLVGAGALQGKLKMKHRGYIHCCFGLWATVIISSLIGRPPIMATINSILTYFSFPIILIYAYQYRSERACRIFIQGSLIFLGLQLLLNAGWILGVNPLPNEFAVIRNMEDIAKGSVGRCDYLAYITISLMFLFYSVIKNKSYGKKTRMACIIAIPLCFLQLYLTHTPHAFFYIPIAGMVYLIFVERSIFKSLRVAALFIIIFISSFFVEKWISSTAVYRTQRVAFQETLSFENLRFRYNVFIMGPKMNLYRSIMLDSLSNEPRQWIIGFGAGNGTSAIGMSRATPGAVKLLAEYYLTTSGRQAMRGASITQQPAGGYISLWSEIGVIGFIYFQMLYLMPLFHISKHLWRGNYKHKSQRILAEAFLPTCLVVMQASFMADIYWSALFYFLLMVWAGFVFDPIPVSTSRNSGS